jgi:hypothetical protein
MRKLILHFRRMHGLEIGARAAARLAEIVRAMGGLEPWMQLGVTGLDGSTGLPRRIDVTLAQLRAVLTLRRRVA